MLTIGPRPVPTGPQAPCGPRRGLIVLVGILVGAAILAWTTGHATAADGGTAPGTISVLDPSAVHPADTTSRSGYFSRAGIMPYIIGGDEADGGAWPYMVAIEISEPGTGEFALCTGDRIAARWVLTAQHCVRQNETGRVVPDEDFTIGLGSTDLSAEQQVVSAARVVPYPYENVQTNTGDIALIELPPHAYATEDVNLARPDDEPSSLPAPVWIAGWGLDSLQADAQTPFLANQARTFLWTQTYCASEWNGNGGGPFVARSELCAGGPNPETGLVTPSGCNGDSGGPLVSKPTRDPWEDELLGTTDYGSSTSCSYLPGVYQRVSYFYDWIVATTGLRATTVGRVRETQRTSSGATVAVWLDAFPSNTVLELTTRSGHVLVRRRFDGSSVGGWTSLRVGGLLADAHYPGVRVVAVTHYGTRESGPFTLRTAPRPRRRR